MNKFRYFLTAAFALGTNDYAVTALADDDSFALSHLPTRCTRTIDLSKLSGERVIASWFNPRTGETTRLGIDREEAPRLRTASRGWLGAGAG